MCIYIFLYLLLLIFYKHGHRYKTQFLYWKKKTFSRDKSHNGQVLFRQVNLTLTIL